MYMPTGVKTGLVPYDGALLQRLEQQSRFIAGLNMSRKNRSLKYAAMEYTRKLERFIGRHQRPAVVGIGIDSVFTRWALNESGVRKRSASFAPILVVTMSVLHAIFSNASDIDALAGGPVGQQVLYVYIILSRAELLQGRKAPMLKGSARNETRCERQDWDWLQHGNGFEGFVLSWWQ
jgi:hypothetical protein